MSFTTEEILTLKTFCQSITRQPRLFEEQFHVRQDEFLWCQDWEIIEICKYLFNGKDMYILDPAPNRLKRNPLWSKEEIMKKCDELIEKYKTADMIINFLKEERLK